MFGEERRLQFRWEAFNALNNTNYNRPNGNVSAPSTLGKIFGAQPARTMQVGAKLYF
jgi:hypothetical protein